MSFGERQLVICSVLSTFGVFHDKMTSVLIRQDCLLGRTRAYMHTVRRRHSTYMRSNQTEQGQRTRRLSLGLLGGGVAGASSQS
jgi:hypothetical protein